MLRSSVLVAFVVLASLAGCTPENAPIIAARTELLSDAGVIATADGWYIDGWCTDRSECEPYGRIFNDYADDGIQLLECLEYECRLFERIRVDEPDARVWGRCFVRHVPDRTAMCRLIVFPSMPELMDGSTSGVPDPYADSPFGAPCTASSDECPYCIDGVCCENVCGGGAIDDCFACSVEAGGARDGLCTPRLRYDTCTPATACTENARCVPGSSIPGGPATDVFSGVCEGTSTAGREIAGEVCCIDDSHCPDDSDGDKCTVPVCVANRCIEKLAYEGCCIFDDQCDNGDPRDCERCVETGRTGWMICESLEASFCGDAGVEDASVSTRDLGEWPLDGSNVDDAEIDRDGEIARDAATRMDGQVERDARIDDADVVVDAEIKADAEVLDASADAAAIPVTPIFRGGGGIRCAVSSAPGSESGGAGLAGAVGLSMIGLMLSRRRRR